MNRFENKIICGDNVEMLSQFPDECIDLTVTSPPYDNLRDYEGYHFRFEELAQQLYRVTKQGGVVVWVVNDSTKNGSESLTSCKQKIFFREQCGFNIHDTMIYRKKNTPFSRSNAYTDCYEFMFVLSKGKPKTFNPLMIKTIRQGREMFIANKKADGTNKKVWGILKERKKKDNIWEYAVGLGGSTNDKIAFTHTAIFPEQLARDHIFSWSNKREIVLDLMCGSGTTLKMAKELNRNYIGIDCSKKYCDLSELRVSQLELGF